MNVEIGWRKMMDYYSYGCGIGYKSNIRKDCVFYHCEEHMGASIDCCSLRGLGNCPCSDSCGYYANKTEIYKLGLEAFKKQQKTFSLGK